MRKDPTPPEAVSAQQSGKPESRTSLARTLGRSTATLMTAAMIIGTGIFWSSRFSNSKGRQWNPRCNGSRRSHCTGDRNQRRTARRELSKGRRSLYLGTRVQPQDYRIRCGLRVPRKRDLFPKRHFPRIRILLSSDNTGSALTAVRWRRDSRCYGPQLLSCSTNNQGVDHSHGAERISIGALCRIFHPRDKHQPFLESVRR